MPIRIPTYDAPQVTQARPPVVFQDPGQTAGAFGERAAQGQVQAGAALQQAGASVGNIAGELAAADRRLQARQDALRLTSADNAARTVAREVELEESQGVNFADEASLTAARKRLQEKMAGVKWKFAGQLSLPESQLALEDSFEKIFGEADRSFVEKGLVASRDALERGNNERIARTTIAISAGDSIDNAWTAYQAEAALRYAPGATPEMEAKANERWVQAAVKAEYERQLLLDNPEAALAALDHPLAKQYVSDPVFVPTLQNRLLKEVKDAAKKTLERDRARVLSPFEAKQLGFAAGTVVAQGPDGKYEVLQKPEDKKGTARFLTPDETKAAGFAAGTIVERQADGEHKVLQKPEDKIKYTPKVFSREETIAKGFDYDAGARLTQTPSGEIKELARPDKPDDPLALLGQGVRGRARMALSYAPPGGVSLRDQYAAGILSPSQERFVEDLMKENMEVSPNTGEKVISPGDAAALRARNKDPASFGDVAAEADVPERPFPAASVTPSSIPDSRESEAAKLAGQQIFSAELTTLLGDRTIAEWVAPPPGGQQPEGGFTGVGPAVRELVGRTPFVGTGAGVTDTLRTAIPAAMMRLITAMQQNPRFAVTERKQWEDILGIDPRLWDNPTAMLGRIVGITTFLDSTRNELVNSVKDVAGQPRTQRRADQTSLRLIEAVRERLAPDIIAETDPAKKEKALLAFGKNNPIGTPLIYMDSSGNWVLKPLVANEPPKKKSR